MFKVVPDQLRVSDGWVRCGQCNEVFDANANLQAGAGDVLISPAPQAPVEPVEPVEPIVPAEPVEPMLPLEKDFGAEAPDAVEIIEVPAEESFLEVNPPALHIEPELQEFVDSSDAAPSETTDQVLPAADDQPQHSFMQSAVSPSRWGRRWVRVALSVICLLLGMVLVLQVVVQERDRIAATEPATRHFLESLCEVLNCRISPLRQIESVVIDSSAFVKVRTDVYRLSFTLKNTAQTVVATPALELTLTDMQDQPVVRRVFVAGDIGKPQMAMEPGAELFVTLPLAVKTSGHSERISGYRLLSFYP